MAARLKESIFTKCFAKFGRVRARAAARGGGRGWTGHTVWPVLARSRRTSHRPRFKEVFVSPLSDCPHIGGLHPGRLPPSWVLYYNTTIEIIISGGGDPGELPGSVASEPPSWGLAAWPGPGPEGLSLLRPSDSV